MAKEFMLRRYRRVEGCLEEAIDDQMLVYNPANGSATQLNSASQQVWALCNGKRRVRKIVRVLKNQHPDAPEDIAKDVRKVLRLLRKQGLVEQVEP